MTTRTISGFSYPPVNTQYTATDGYTVAINGQGVSVVTHTGNLNVRDTTSRFNLNGPPPTATPTPPATSNTALYFLPGLPLDSLITPTIRKLVANLASGGTATIAPPDYALLPTPLLADFVGIVLQHQGDTAHVRWTGSLWTLVDASPGVAVLSIGQTLS